LEKSGQVTIGDLAAVFYYFFKELIQVAIFSMSFAGTWGIGAMGV
jgi:hypothetical protein